MRKRKRGYILSRKSGQRKALIKSLMSALFLHEKIKTTEAKAKAVAPFADKCITRAKDGKIHSRRLLAGVFSPNIVKKLMDDIAPRYKERRGGYTIIKLGPRKSDGAKMAVIELVK